MAARNAISQLRWTPHDRWLLDGSPIDGVSPHHSFQPHSLLIHLFKPHTCLRNPLFTLLSSHSSLHTPFFTPLSSHPLFTLLSSHPSLHTPLFTSFLHAPFSHPSLHTVLQLLREWACTGESAGLGVAVSQVSTSVLHTSHLHPQTITPSQLVHPPGTNPSIHSKPFLPPDPPPP